MRAIFHGERRTSSGNAKMFRKSDVFGTVAQGLAADLVVLTVFRRYVSDEKHISIKKFRFEDCTRDFLLDYLAYLNKSGYAARTCNNRLAAVRAYLWYVADGDIAYQSIALTASKVPSLRVVKRIRETIGTKDFAAFLAAPPNTKIGLRDRAIMILLYDSAIRVSELLEMKVSSINNIAPIPYIRVHGKGDKERIVEIPNQIDHLAADYRPRCR